MEIIFLLLSISIVLALFFLFSFFWANKNGQFEDIEGPAMRILFDEEVKKVHHKAEKNANRKI
ncbi:MAG: cbb3-type cytochrome oxidase assembly protein CcoS [Crocinitomicaceae bacterium]